MPADVTQLLISIKSGDQTAAEELLPLVYEELRKLASQKMAQERSRQTLQPTALVHEAWLRLGGDKQPAWENRAHFFGAAAEAMRRILIDRARKRQVRKTSGLEDPQELQESQIECRVADEELLALHEVLDRFAIVDSQAARLVKLRYFIGMNVAEVANTLGLSQRQTERLWTFTKAWLRDAIQTDKNREQALLKK